jgi:hypothetical protein
VACASRDRVTIDLRGIGDAVRSAATERSLTVAALARQALLDAVGAGRVDAPILSFTSAGPAHRTLKLTVRLRQLDAEALVLNAGALGLSYGDYVARLVNGTPLPPPVAEREADRAALRASTDQLAAIETDLLQFLRLLAKLDIRGMEPFQARIHSLHIDLRRHLDLASKLMARDA